MSLGNVTTPGRVNGDARTAAAAIDVDQSTTEDGRGRVADPLVVAARPNGLAVVRVQSLQRCRAGYQQLRLPVDLRQHRCTVRPVGVGTLLLPRQFACLAVERQQ